MDSGPLPTDAETASLLADSPIQPAVSPLTDHETSPTMAIKSAIEAKISEEQGEFDVPTFKPNLPLTFKRDQGAAESTHTGPITGPVSVDSALVKTKPINSGTDAGSRGAGVVSNRDPRIPVDHAASKGGASTQNTYADRTKTKTRPEELGRYILHIYTTQD